MAFSRPLLQLLSNGHFYSGTQLGDMLGCSRAAVWKMIQVLESAGVDIFHVRGKGYRLARAVELLDEKQILAAIPGASRSYLSGVDVFFDIDSTNTYLMQRPLSHSEVGRACIAEVQQFGRGRRGRQWVSPFGSNLYLSLRWRFSRGVAQLGGLSLAVGVAVTNALRQTGVKGLGLKWPNDIFLQNKKLAGVLLEVSGESSGPCEVVIGVGVNVCSTEFSQEAIDQPWTDLESILEKRVSRNLLAAQVIGELMTAAQLFDKQGFAVFREEWMVMDILSGHDVVLMTPAAEVRGIEEGVDMDGALLLTLGDGSRQSFHGGEVSLRAARTLAVNA